LRRGEGEGLARQGRAAPRGGRAGFEGAGSLLKKRERAARGSGARARRRSRPGPGPDPGAGRPPPPPAARPARPLRHGDRPRRQDRAVAAYARTGERGARRPARVRRDRRSRVMRVAALYDVHGMPWALEAVLAEVEREGADAIVFGGDNLYGPYPDDVVT